MFQQLQKELESSLKKIQANRPDAHTISFQIYKNDKGRVSAFVHYGANGTAGCDHFSDLAELERFAIAPEYTNPILWRKF